MQTLNEGEVCQQLQERREDVRHPSYGWGEPYSQEMRQLVMAIRAAGLTDHPFISQFRLQHDYPCMRTERRWDALATTFGHYMDW